MVPQQVTKTVTTAGTPVQVSTTKVQCAMIWFVNRDSQVMTAGILGLVKSSGTGVIQDIPAASAGSELGSNVCKLPFNPMNENPYDLRDYWIDATTDGGKMDVIYWVL